MTHVHSTLFRLISMLDLPLPPHDLSSRFPRPLSVSLGHWALASTPWSISFPDPSEREEKVPGVRDWRGMFTPPWEMGSPTEGNGQSRWSGWRRLEFLLGVTPTRKSWVVFLLETHDRGVV